MKRGTMRARARVVNLPRVGCGLRGASPYRKLSRLQMVGRDSVEPGMNDWPDINPFAADFDNHEVRHHVGVDTHNGEL
jgi:hypothetical protein